MVGTIDPEKVKGSLESLTSIQNTAPAPTSAPTPSDTETLSQTPTRTPQPILISYQRYGGDGEGGGEFYSCIRWLAPYHRFVLYEDGQLVLYRSGIAQETHLSDPEITNLLQEISNTGFFEIQESEDAPDFVDIYDLPDNFQFGDGGPGSSIMVQDTFIHVRDELWDHLKPPVKNTISIITEYTPQGNLDPYIPNTLEMMVLSIENAESYGLDLPIPREWPAELFPLDYMYQYFDENISDDILNTNIFDSFPDESVFTYDGKEYLVVTCPNRFDY
jgi:hypothetical protein